MLVTASMVEDKPKSMWEATQRFMLEGTGRNYWLAYKAKHPDLFEHYERKEGRAPLTSEIGGEA